jgi:hypothetical protein
MAILGYVKVSADYAQLGKLHRGYEQHLKDPRFIPGKNLTHLNLPPMDTNNVIAERKEIELAERGETNPYPYGHYLQGTYFRTWPYKDRDGFEVRDAHKEMPILERETRRLTLVLEKGFSGYEQFAHLEMAAQGNLFMEPATRKMAKDALGKAAFLPLRPFELDYPVALEMTPHQTERFRARIVHARSAYLEELEQIAETSIGVEPVPRLRLAIARFAHASGIYPLLDAHLTKLAKRSLGLGLSRTRPVPPLAATRPARPVQPHLPFARAG